MIVYKRSFLDASFESESKQGLLYYYLVMSLKDLLSAVSFNRSSLLLPQHQPSPTLMNDLVTAHLFVLQKYNKINNLMHKSLCVFAAVYVVRFREVRLLCKG